jgi:hypothetical protein
MSSPRNDAHEFVIARSDTARHYLPQVRVRIDKAGRENVRRHVDLLLVYLKKKNRHTHLANATKNLATITRKVKSRNIFY